MTQQVRVRFAPSPTGFLHVGGARTALFNWLYAKKAGGKFILRIEDTDQQRSTTEATEGLLKDLKWLGLTWDEGPEVGGDYGPYFQSERLDIYRQYANKLLENKTAYYCFCSEEELEAKKEKAKQQHQNIHYDGTCRNLTESEVQAKLDSGLKPVIRVKVPAENYSIKDLVRGTVTWKARTLGDFIIMRSTNMPVYNFCVVVDDASMKISHVIRAEEHLTNTHRQILLYQALGITPPVFAHASLILGEDKSKLSKRHGATSVGQYQQDGFLPEALVNFLALLGWNEGNDREIYSVTELIESFSLERISKSPGVFDQNKLTWMNGQHLRAMSTQDLTNIVGPELKKSRPDDTRLSDSQTMYKLVDLIKIKMNLLHDAVKVANSILDETVYEDQASKDITETQEALKLFQTLSNEFKNCEWNREGYNAAIKNAGKISGIKGKNLFMPIRAKITGSCQGPDLVSIMDILGREEIIKRLTT